MRDHEHELLFGELTRRRLLQRASALGLGALVVAAVPCLDPPGAAAAGPPDASDATLQAFADTILPGRRVTRTESGAVVDPLAIAGVDPLPGAVEADALALFRDPRIGFATLEAAFLAELEARSLAVGLADFLRLPFDARVRVCLGGLDASNTTALVWDAAAAVAFTAFCAAALVPNATAANAVGYRVMGLPGTAPGGYADFSYRRRLARERTIQGSLG